MQKKKENLIGKIVKKNYNNKLEEVLEHKNYSENTKSLLLSMLYRIEEAYPNYAKAKRNVESKEEYIEKIISTIKDKCSVIDVISPSSPRSAELGRNIFLIDDKKKSIKCFPVERKLLYAISKLAKRKCIVDEGKYQVIAKPLSNLINIGNNIDSVEPLRDFNGYSWATLSKEIESIEHNIVYQNLRMLLGYQFLKSWVENREFITDYMVVFRKMLKGLYGERYAKQIEELVLSLAVLLDLKYNKTGRENLENSEDNVLEQLELIEDKMAFTENVYDRKMQINEKIRNIDTVINNRNLLENEFYRRNQNLPEDKKMFNIRNINRAVNAGKR